MPNPRTVSNAIASQTESKIESIRYLYIYGDLNLNSGILTTPWSDVTFGQALLVLVGFDILAIGIFRPALRRLFD
ncbi:MAG: hypothetical protein QNJ38_09680 [Prochloraceae cyanobacterium]|nr:hypothetical protein [Prochloraceae cyanobacterium]